MADNPPDPADLPRAPQVPRTEGVPPRPEPFLGRAAPLYGLVIGTLVYVIAYGLSIAINGRDSQASWVWDWLGFGALATLVILIAGNVLSILPRTRAFGAGLLISLGVGIIVGSGVCIALLNAG